MELSTSSKRATRREPRQRQVRLGAGIQVLDLRTFWGSGQAIGPGADQKAVSSGSRGDRPASLPGRVASRDGDSDELDPTSTLRLIESPRSDRARSAVGATDGSELIDSWDPKPGPRG